MKPAVPPIPASADEELETLIATLHRTGERLEILTAGQVDSVVDRSGRTFLLRGVQEQLRHAEDSKQAAVLNALPAHIALLDTRGTILSVNEAWRRFGADNGLHGAGRTIGANYLEICDGAVGANAAEARQAADGVRAVLHDGKAGFSLEYPCHSPTAQRWFLMTVSPLPGTPPSGAVIMHLDITDRRVAQESQHRTSLLLDMIIENIPSAVQVKSVQDKFRIEIWNKAAEALYGVPRAEAIGRTVHDLWPKADADRMHAADLDLASSGTMQDFPDRLARTRHRGDIRVHMRKVLLAAADGSAGHLLILADDRTAQLADQALLRDSEARFRSLSLLSSDWFWEQDEQHRFVRFSGGNGIGGWGPDQDQAVGLHRWDLGGVVPISASWDEHRAQLDAHQPFRNFEYRRVLTDGRLQYVEASGEPTFDVDGRFTGYRGVATEITARKENEARILGLNRVHAVLSGINSAIVRIRERDELFREVCRIAVTVGEFALARVVVLDAAGHVSIAASTEPVTPVIDRIIDEYNGNPLGSGTLLGLALRNRQPVIANDVANDPRMPNRAALTKKGNFAVAILPFFAGPRLVGAIHLRARTAGTFNDGEIRLLRELTANISLALEHIEQEARFTAMASEQKQALLALRESERRFSDILDNVELISMMVNGVARITYCNDYLLRLTGWKLEEVLGRYWHETFIPPEDTSVNLRFAAILAEEPGSRHCEVEILTRSGARLLVRWNNTVLRSSAGEVIGWASIGEDITERKRAEIGMQALHRVNAMLSGINALIVRVTDREELFREACRIAVEAGGFHVAWIGIADHASSKLDFSASAGADAPLITSIRELFSSDAGSLAGKTLVARAIGARRGFYSNDSGNDPAVPFGAKYARFGVRSMAILPLVIADASFGVLVLYSREIDFFHEEEMRLLSEFAGNIAFAIGIIANEIERRDAEAKVIRLNRVYAVLSGINSLIVRVRDRDELFEDACRVAVNEGGFRMAWVATIDPETGRILPVASAGLTEDKFEGIKAFYAAQSGPPEGDSLAAKAMSSGKPSISNDLANNTDTRLGSKYADTGILAIAFLPLMVADKAVGVMALYSEIAHFFNDEEMRLLRELAGDIGHAIDHLGRQERLDYLAYYDALTGLANRTLFLERVAQHVRSAAAGGQRLAVFLIDLERFKNINDSLGRAAGDALLNLIADWLKRNAGEASLLARIAADQFAIVMPALRAGGSVARLIEKTLAAFLRHPFRLNDALLRVSAKVGAAIYPDNGADADTLLRNAEAALKRAKSAGESYLLYSTGMTDQAASKLTLENRLREALEKDEFVLHYQPKVSLEGAKLTGLEALIRWNDPHTGLVPPGRFIPVLEETGMINEVGRWALRQALRDYLRWRDAGRPAVRVSVNVSPMQLRNPDFIAEIEQVLSVDPKAGIGLELEITEGLIMADIKHSIASLKAIRALGVTISIDDFGTGFSSLSYLAKLPVDTLKIDRSFVTDMTLGPDGLALVSTIISLAHSLSMKVVAEGVETAEQSRLLRLLNCDQAQGFLYSKPLPAEELEALYLALPGTPIVRRP